MQTKRIAKAAEETITKKKNEDIKVDVETLVPLEKFLEAGVHIGSRFKTGEMRKFIYKIRSDELCILDIGSLNERVKIIANFLSRYNPQGILIVAGRTYAQRPAKKLAELIGARYVIGRFIPGMLTNPSNPEFIEPEVIFTADPPTDRQVIKEAVSAKIPVVSLCDTNNSTKNIDVVLPANNKGKKSLALIYWMLAREILKNNGTIKSNNEFTPEIQDFEAQVEKEKIRDTPVVEIKRPMRPRRKR